MLWLRSVKYRHKCQLFYDSFKYLYYSIRTLAQSKVVFLFSQGISTTFQQLEDHEEDKYRFQLQEIANFLNLSGAALFVINPAMADNEDGGSGRESLRYLAVASGGKYLAGTKATIVKKVNNMNRAYYELAFAEDETLKDNAPSVAVKAKRRGVRIYSVNHIARRKTLADMNTMEREMVVVSLLNRNPFVTMEMKVFRLTVSKVAESDTQGTCTIFVPAQLLNQPVELYKVNCDPQGNIKKMESMPITPRATAIKIEIPQDEKQANSALRLVLLDIAGNRAWVE
jgi:hypothetical protein